MPNICVTARSITQLPVDAIITTLSSDGRSLNATDEAIIELVGMHFHDRVRRALPTKDGTALYMRRIQQYMVRFDGVIFVIDDGKRSISEIISNTLVAADKEHLNYVSLAVPRVDTRDIFMDKSFEHACSETRRAIDKHHHNNPNSRLRIINVCVGPHRELLERALQVM